jgi:hypothetical protein
VAEKHQRSVEQEMNFDDLKVAISSAVGIGNWMVEIDLILKVGISAASLVYIILKIRQLLRRQD